MPASASRTPPPSPKRVPPSSPTKRRRFLKESEDNAGVLTIEQYIYRTDPYRSSSVAFPLPTPLYLEYVDAAMLERLTNDSTLSEHIADTLGRHYIVPQGISCVKQSKPGYPAGGDTAVAVIRITINVGDNSPTDTWSAARRDVKALLIERALGDLEVELIDPARFYMPSLFPVAPTDPLVRVYEANREEILNIVESALKKVWTSISLFRVGRTSLSTQCAIVIMVHPLAEYDWLILRWRIERLVNTQGGSQERMTVEFVPGYWGELPPQGESTGKSFDQNFVELPAMGTSIGVLGEGGGGTLGGFFQLHCHGRMHTGFLTNSHVVQPPSSAPDVVQREYNYYGCQYASSINHPTRSTVRYFAEKDVQATRDAVKKSFREVTQTIARKEQEIQERRSMGMPVNITLTAIEGLKLEKDRLNKMKPALDSMPRTLGKVLCASGKGVTHANRILDWAFVETPASIQSRFDPRRGNFLPQQNAQGLIGNMPQDYGCRLPYTPLPELPIQEFGKIEKGQWYFKIGRTTGITTGVCNGTATKFRLADEPKHVIHNKAGEVDATVKMDNNTVEELVIVNSKFSIFSPSTQKTFCSPGDSGSLLIDAEGRVAGLVYGAMTGQCGPFKDESQYVQTGLATDIRDVLASIAAKTTDPKNGLPGRLSIV